VQTTAAIQSQQQRKQQRQQMDDLKVRKAKWCRAKEKKKDALSPDVLSPDRHDKCPTACLGCYLAGCLAGCLALASLIWLESLPMA
jgi:hypothetical protein